MYIIVFHPFFLIFSIGDIFSLPVPVPRPVAAEVVVITRLFNNSIISLTVSRPCLSSVLFDTLSTACLHWIVIYSIT
jgi:hypothetical protein